VAGQCAKLLENVNGLIVEGDQVMVFIFKRFIKLISGIAFLIAALPRE
jgi:hypothetical protein